MGKTIRADFDNSDERKTKRRKPYKRSRLTEELIEVYNLLSKTKELKNAKRQRIR